MIVASWLLEIPVRLTVWAVSQLLDVKVSEAPEATVALVAVITIVTESVGWLVSFSCSAAVLLDVARTWVVVTVCRLPSTVSEEASDPAAAV